MKRLLYILPVLAVTACAGTSQTRATNALAIACDGYATALEQATPFKPKMSVDTVKRIDSANEKVAQVCKPGISDAISDAITLVEQATNLIKTARGVN